MRSTSFSKQNLFDFKGLRPIKGDLLNFLAGVHRFAQSQVGRKVGRMRVGPSRLIKSEEKFRESAAFPRGGTLLDGE